MPRRFPSIAVALAAGLAAACSPNLDWREFTPAESGIGVTFPCRPDRQARAVVLGGAPVRMAMFACSASDMTFALTFADVADPTRIGPGLEALRQTAVLNIAGQAPSALPYELAGMTPHALAGRLVVSGRLPDGTVVQEHAAFFTRGLRLYQASVIGAHPTAAAVEGFFGGFKFPA